MAAVDDTIRLRSWPPDDATLQCPHALFAELREKAPVYLCPEPSADGTRPYVVTGFEHVAEVLMRSEVFVNDLTGVLPSHDANILPEADPQCPTLYNPNHVFFSDGEDHKVKRSWIMKLGDRRRLEAYRPLIAEEVDRLLDAFIDDGECDFRRQFTELMPLGMVRRILDLPPEVDPLVKAVSLGIANTENNPNLTEADLAAFEEVVMELLTVLADVIRERQESPGDDFISEIVALQVERDGALDVNTLARNIAMAIFGADHAMGGHIAHMVARLAREPELQERVRADRSLIRSLDLETLRADIPVPWVFRQCVTDTVLGGVEIPAGSLVLATMISGNYDPAEFPSPDAFDVDRGNLEKNQLSLGRGAHRCVGAPVARLLGEVTIDRVLDRMGNIRLDEEKSVLLTEPSFVFRISPEIHLTFEKLQ